MKCLSHHILWLTLVAALVGVVGSPSVGASLLPPRPYLATEWDRHIIPIPTADWITNPAAARQAASEICARFTTAPFGSAWPPMEGGAECRNFVGDGSGSTGSGYWVHRCQSTRFGGGWFEDYYFLSNDTTGTMERFTWVAESPTPAQEWIPFIRNLIRGFVQQGGKTIGGNDSTYAVFQFAQRLVSLELYFDPERPSIRRLTVDCFSVRLREATRRNELAFGEDVEPTVFLARERFEKDLKASWPSLALALTSDSVRSRDVPGVAASLRAAARLPRGDVRADLAFFAADRWLERLVETSSDSARLDAVGSMLRPYGVHISQGTNGWCYDGALRESLATHAGSSYWADLAYLKLMDYGCSDPCGYDFFDDGTPLRVIDRGTGFLAKHPHSLVAREVELRIAQAHETAWCMSQLPFEYHDTESESFQTIRAGGPSHRVQAIALYERYLSASPDSTMRVILSRRLVRLRNSIDTAYYKYWFAGD